MAIAISSLSAYITGNATLQEAQVICLLGKHSSAEHARLHDTMISTYAQERDILLLEDKEEESKLKSLKQKSLEIKVWTDPKETEKAVALCHRYKYLYRLYQIGQLLLEQDGEKAVAFFAQLKTSPALLEKAQHQALEKINQYVIDTFSQRQDNLIHAISKELNSKDLYQRRIFVLMGSHHGDLATSPFYLEVKKLISFLNDKTKFCIYKP